MVCSLREAGAHEHARQQDALRIGEAGAQGDGAGGLVDQHLGKLDDAGPAIVAAVLQLQAYHRLRRGHAARGERPSQRQQRAGGLLDVDIDRIEPLDLRERIGLAGRHQRADGEQRPADAAGDRRRHGGEVEVEPCRIERGAVLGDSGGGLARAGDGVGIVLLRHRLDLGKRLVALGLGAARLGTRLRARQVGGGLAGLGAIAARVDLIERLSLRHQRAFGEQPAKDDAAYLGPHVRVFIGGGPPGQFGNQRRVARLEHDEAHLGRALAGLARAGALALLVAPAAACGQHQCRCQAGVRR